MGRVRAIGSRARVQRGLPHQRSDEAVRAAERPRRPPHAVPGPRPRSRATCPAFSGARTARLSQSTQTPATARPRARLHGAPTSSAFARTGALHAPAAASCWGIARTITTGRVATAPSCYAPDPARNAVPGRGRLPHGAGAASFQGRRDGSQWVAGTRRTGF
jgi:hypothetical protein